MIEFLDREAGRLGVTRQSIIKVWIAERLEHQAGSGVRGEGSNPVTEWAKRGRGQDRLKGGTLGYDFGNWVLHRPEGCRRRE
jgi:hypothetical protein